MHSRQILFVAFVFARAALAQFDPKMPAGVPEVTGEVVENLSMH